jgi:hypothetical protein
VNYEVGFADAFLTDTASVDVGGLLAPRLDFTAGAFYTRGSVGFKSNDNGFSNTAAFANLRSAITKNLAVYAQYFYYKYGFQSGVTLPSFLQPELDRQGVTVGLTAFLPLVGKRGNP